MRELEVACLGEVILAVAESEVPGGVVAVAELELPPKIEEQPLARRHGSRRAGFRRTCQQSRGARPRSASHEGRGRQS